jgi:hypothetical protein
MMHCDDRLIAALYVLTHYPASDPSTGSLDIIAANEKAGVVVILTDERPE